MLRRLFLSCFVVFFLFLSLGFSAQVNVFVDVGNESTEFVYKFDFGKDESYGSFSFEKPKDSLIIYALSDGKMLDYSIAGDYFIFKPDIIRNKSFEIKFTSKDVSLNLKEKNTFATYLNFNIPVEKLVFNLKFDLMIGDVLEIFPRDYEITSNGVYVWEFDEIEADKLFLVRFKEVDSNSANDSEFELDSIFLLLFIIPIVLFFFLLFYIRKHFSKDDVEDKKSDKKDEKKEKKSKEDKVKDEESDVENKVEGRKKDGESEKISDEESRVGVVEEGVVEKSEDEETFESVIDKYLTDNEKEVVRVVREHGGIAQFDILNFLPSLTKSNLSKIISKLHSKKFLNRIKVGKINKIYLGEKLENLK